MMDAQSLWKEIATRLQRAVPEVSDVRLFGSQARGDARPDSDVDLLLILPQSADRNDVLLRARKSLRHLGVGFDLLLLTPAEWARLQEDQSWLSRELVREARRLDAVGGTRI